jgi:radical SAM superfamily enzyme YgiQ (UPF0313 family)
MSLSKQRYRKPEKIMEEIKEVYKFHHEEKTHILFGDPHVLGKADRIDRLCDLLISENMEIYFTAMVRADSIAKNPEVVKKMVKAGIIGYCMGIESPAQGELNNTKKGITAQMQKDAVRLLRENHAVAGGTFIIGLQGQTEEEIKTLDEYGWSLGMINAAFAIVTPQAGTEFYNELDSKGLINDRDWTSYDQMHSVFEHDTLSKEKLEQLLTHCIGRFYAPDIFIDDIIEGQLRNNETSKITLQEAFNHFRNRVRFIMKAGGQYRPTDSEEYGMIFLKAQINPWTRMRTEKMGIHNMIQLDSFLKAFGNQKVQISLLKDGKSFVHYMFKTTKTSVEYFEICEKPHSDATLNLELDFKDLQNGKSHIIVKMLSKVIKRNEIVPVIRGALALFIDYISVSKSAKGTQKIPNLPTYKDQWFLMDGWDEEEYKKLKSN